MAEYLVLVGIYQKYLCKCKNKNDNQKQKSTSYLFMMTPQVNELDDEIVNESEKQMNRLKLQIEQRFKGLEKLINK